MISLVLLLFLTYCFCGNDYVILERKWVKNAGERKAVCNDRTDAVFYTRFVDSKTNWLIYLMGGGDCYSIESCQNHWKLYPFVMSTENTRDTIAATAIFGDDCESNPAFCNSNRVFIYYCTSDMWSGDISASNDTGNFEFRGKNVVKAVIEDLLEDYDLDKAESVTLSGDSEGGVGCWSNSDDVREMIVNKNPEVNYRVICDSGWYLDGKGYKELPCVKEYCNFEQRFKYGSVFWNLIPHKACEEYFKEDSWKCLVGYYIYPYIQSNKMAIFYEYDNYQAHQDGISAMIVKDLSSKERTFVNLRGSFNQQTIIDEKLQVWSPGCYQHGVLDQDVTYNEIKVGGKSCSEAIDEFVKTGKVNYFDTCKDVHCNPTCWNN